MKWDDTGEREGAAEEGRRGGGRKERGEGGRVYSARSRAPPHSPSSTPTPLHRGSQ